MNIQAINAELAKIGYKAVKLPGKARCVVSVRGPMASSVPIDCLTVSNWKPHTPAGRKCKAHMLMLAKLPKGGAITNYQVKGADGQWYSDWMDGFAEAVAYQKAMPRPRTGYYSGNH